MYRHYGIITKIVTMSHTPWCMLQPGSQLLHWGVNLATLEAPTVVSLKGMIQQKVIKYVMLYIYIGIHLKQKISKILRKNFDSPVYATPGSHLKSQFFPRI